MTKQNNIETNVVTTRKRLLILAMATVTSLTVVGCDKLSYHEPFLTRNDHEKQHVIEVGKKSHAIKVSAQRGSDGLTRYQERKVRNFVRAYSSDPQGQIVIAAPSGAANEVETRDVLQHIRAITKEYEIPVSAMKLKPYYAEGQYAPPIRMSFVRYVAIPPECEDWSENLARDRENIPYPNFGCARQKNLARMVANPRDLQQPRGMDPTSRPSDRRDVVFDKYRKGEVTSAKRSNDERTAISDVAQDRQ